MYRRIVFSLLSAFCCSLLCIAQSVAIERDYSVNVENEAVRRYMNEVVYHPHDNSLIDNYRTVDNNEDQPNAVVMDLPPTNSDSLYIIMYDSATHGDSLHFHVSALHKTVELYNLIPRRTYEYRIFTDADTLQRGKIETQGQVRMIKISGTVRNIRDIGGWKTTDNQRIKYGKIFRGSTLNGDLETTEEGIKIMRDLGVEAELDLRAYYNPLNGVSAFGFSSDSSNYYYSNNSGQLPEHMTYYTFQYRWRMEFQFIVNNLRNNHAVYEHCVWGQDRTGYLTLLLEGLLGLSYSDIIKEYELTFFAYSTKSKKDSIDKVLDYIETLDGETLRDKFNTYFVNTLLVSQSDIDYFRDVMLEAIEPDDPIITDVNNRSVINEDEPLLYDMKGYRVNSMRKGGLYLLQDSSGKTYKLFNHR